MTRRVIILHGIWNTDLWLKPLASRLRAAGFEPEIFAYSSVSEPPERIASRLIAHVSGNEEVSLVGHSMGGLIALLALRTAPEIPVARVVCLGSPLRGSRTAREIVGRAWAAPLLGRSAGLLQQGFAGWEGRAEIGVVAGNVPRGLGRLFCRFDGDSDGTVAVEETKLPGLKDHCIVSASHSGLVFSRQAAAQCVRFLDAGRFEQRP